MSAALDALVGRSLLSPLARGGRRGLSTLIYHRVLEHQDPLFPGELDRAGFARQIALLKSCCNVLPLREAIGHLRDGTLPPRAACITFDDGYADNAEMALPVLRHYGVPATFFVASGFLDGGCMWNDRVIDMVRRVPGALIDADALGLGRHPVATLEERRGAIAALIGRLKYLPMEERQHQVERLAAVVGVAAPPSPMMRADQVRQLHAAGMDIGAHTVHHPILARLPARQARAEIADGRRALEDIVKAPVPLFAYPNGKPGDDYLAEHVAMVRELGFEGAVSTAWGAGAQPPDLFQLPRFTPWDRGSARFMLRLARNLARPAGSARAGAGEGACP